MNQVSDGMPPTVPAVGAVVAGKYRIERILAEGGMGVVVAATHLHLGRRVAIKFLRGDPDHVNSQWDALARFSLEAKIASRLVSEHVAHVLDAGVTDDGTAYMVMEYLEGLSLAQTLQVQGALEVATAVEYAIQACEGLAEAHAFGIVHRDIKPYNLFLVERSPGWHAVKIVDFGISKLVASDAPNVATGVIIGSPCYMSPEQLRSTAVDHRSDIWSLGATLHELLAGKAAFDASQTLPELVTAILEKPVPSLHELRAEVPEELAAVVTRCLAKDREARFQSAGEVAMALLAFAPVRARVPAEWAAAMKPAFAFSSRSSNATPELQWLAPDPGVQPDAPLPSDRVASGPSLAPVSMAAQRISEIQTPPALTTFFAEPMRVDQTEEVARRRPPKWLWVATSAVAAALLLLLGVIVAAPGDGSRESSAANAPPKLRVLPALALPETPLPTATLGRLEPLQPSRAEVTVGAASARAQATVDATSDANIPISLSRNRSYKPVRSGKHVAASQDPLVPGAAKPTTETTVAPAEGTVDSMGGKAPLRPIETRDPYGLR